MFLTKRESCLRQGIIIPCRNNQATFIVEVPKVIVKFSGLKALQESKTEGGGQSRKIKGRRNF